MSESIKILVACPTFDGLSYCLDKFIERIKSLSYPSYDLLMVDNSESDDYLTKLKAIEGVTALKDNAAGKKPRERIVSSRNKILDYARSKDYSHILMMDQDVIPPADIIESLLNCKKDIVSGLYFNYFMSSGKLKVLPVAWKSLTKQEFEILKTKVRFPPLVKSHLDLRRHLIPKEFESNDVQEVIIPSGGCMLISRKVFERVRYELLDLQALGFQDKSVKTTDDIGFAMNAKKHGFARFCNTKVKCDHLVQEKYTPNGKGNLVNKLLKD